MTGGRGNVGRRIGAVLIDGILYVFVFFIVSEKVDIPPIAFMQDYTAEQQANYWKLSGYTLMFGFLYSLLMHGATGGTIGKWLFDIRMVKADGSRLTWRRALLRTLCVYGVAAWIFVPGPLVAAIFGPGSEAASGIFLAAALAAAPIVLLPEIEYGQSVHHRIAGVRVVRSTKPHVTV